MVSSARSTRRPTPPTSPPPPSWWAGAASCSTSTGAWVGWLQPGGHLEPGEAPADAALRERREETGLPASFPPGGPGLIRLDVHTAARGHVHLDLCFLATAPDADPDPPPGESQEVAWFPWEEAERLADDGLSGDCDPPVESCLPWPGPGSGRS